MYSIVPFWVLSTTAVPYWGLVDIPLNVKVLPSGIWSFSNTSTWIPFGAPVAGIIALIISSTKVNSPVPAPPWPSPPKPSIFTFISGCSPRAANNSLNWSLSWEAISPPADWTCKLIFSCRAASNCSLKFVISSKRGCKSSVVLWNPTNSLLLRTRYSWVLTSPKTGMVKKRASYCWKKSSTLKGVASWIPNVVNSRPPTTRENWSLL